MKNERGYALLIVLVIITITFTFAFSMSGMALNARKQFNKTDNLNKATDLAEMGITHYQAVLARIVEASNAKADADSTVKNGQEYDEAFYDHLFQAIQQHYRNIGRHIDGNSSYKVNFDTLSPRNNGQIALTFNSEGKADEEIKILTVKAIIQKNGSSLAGNPMTDAEDYTIHEDNPIILKAKDKHLTYDSSTYFEKAIHVQGNRLLTISGNAFFQEQIQFLGTADIIVQGDAIFMVPPDFNGKSYSFCVYGNTYLVDNEGKLIEYTDFPSGKNKSCPKPKDDEWYIDPDNGIDVTY